MYRLYYPTELINNPPKPETVKFESIISEANSDRYSMRNMPNTQNAPRRTTNRFNVNNPDLVCDNHSSEQPTLPKTTYWFNENRREPKLINHAVACGTGGTGTTPVNKKPQSGLT